MCSTNQMLKVELLDSIINKEIDALELSDLDFDNDDLINSDHECIDESVNYNNNSQIINQDAINDEITDLKQSYYGQNSNELINLYSKHTKNVEFIDLISIDTDLQTPIICEELNSDDNECKSKSNNIQIDKVGSIIETGSFDIPMSLQNNKSDCKVLLVSENLELIPIFPSETISFKIPSLNENSVNQNDNNLPMNSYDINMITSESVQPFNVTFNLNENLSQCIERNQVVNNELDNFIEEALDDDNQLLAQLNQSNNESQVDMVGSISNDASQINQLTLNNDIVLQSNSEKVQSQEGIPIIDTDGMEYESIIQYAPTLQISREDLENISPRSWSLNWLKGRSFSNNLTPNDPVYQQISSRFSKSVKDDLKIENISRIENLFAYLMYELKRLEITKLHGSCKELLLFHGTKAKFANSIREENFDWRCFGKDHKFGKGVYFSPLSSYASYYTDEFATGNKMMLVRVICANTCRGNDNMAYPPFPNDTAVNFERKVYCKFDDHTFYPEYEITYEGRLINWYLLRKHGLLQKQMQQSQTYDFSQDYPEHSSGWIDFNAPVENSMYRQFPRQFGPSCPNFNSLPINPNGHPFGESFPPEHHQFGHNSGIPMCREQVQMRPQFSAPHFGPEFNGPNPNFNPQCQLPQFSQSHGHPQRMAPQPYHNNVEFHNFERDNNNRRPLLPRHDFPPDLRMHQEQSHVSIRNEMINNNTNDYAYFNPPNQFPPRQVVPNLPERPMKKKNIFKRNKGRELRNQSRKFKYLAKNNFFK